MTAEIRSDRVVVIGGGPAGIGAGIALGDRGTVLDGAPDLGGLCRTIELDGALFDMGGHSFHTPHPGVRDLVFNSLEMYEQQREARCHSHGVMIDYPFQAHFRQLPDPRVVGECAAGLDGAAGGEGAGNFEEFIEFRFGSGIARHFLRPYNRKLWRTDLSELATDWVGERVAAPDSAGAMFASSGGKRTPLQADTRVAYPARGGYGEIYRALGRRMSDLRLGRRVGGLDPARRRLTLEGGEVILWSRVVSTIPVDRLLALLPDVPPMLKRDVGGLRRLSLALVLVVIDHPVDVPVQRIYSADPAIPFHKLVINHNSSPSLRSRPRHGVLAEVSFSPEVPLPPGDLAGPVVGALESMGLIWSADEVHGVTVIHVPYAYPIPTHARDAVVRRAKDWLEERGVHTVGRFGEWAYINSDEAFSRGLELGRTLADLD